jgi:site-specific DNA-methyltransferase (adenine-specific)
VDLVLTDPPYDSKTHEGAVLYDNIDFSPLGSAGNLASELLGYTHSWCLCFCSLEMLGAYQKGVGDAWIRAGVWDRVVNMPQMSGDRPAQGAEGIAIMHPKGMKKWNGGGKAAIWRYQVERGQKSHPTQKPLKLISELMQLFSNEGDIALDPFMGSGTTLRAAKDLGRKAIGIEIEEKYCEIAVKRLAQEVFDFE